MKTGPFVAIKAVASTLVDVKIVGFARLFEGILNGSHILDGWILIQGAKQPQDRALDVWRAINRRWPITERDENTSTIVN